MNDFESLWGEEFDLPKEKEKVKKIAQKIAKPKTIKETRASIGKKVKSKALSLTEKLDVITQEVHRVLGKQEGNILVIKTRKDFDDYIDQCIATGRIDIDTETNNSLDPITCKLMGPCIYAPGLKQAYIPINHRNPETKERLDWQLTEDDCREEFQKINDSKIDIIMHNGKFDYSVIKCTCGIEVVPTWDTLIGAKLLDENERSAGLKQQYIEKIDSDQEKYSIDHLFENVEYADVDPDVFAYYAATDALMTDKLYEWQAARLLQPDYKDVYKLFKEIEMPAVQVLAEMQLNGMAVDQEYADLLSKKFHKRLDGIDAKINEEFTKLKPVVDAWRLSPEANYHEKTYFIYNKNIVKKSDIEMGGTLYNLYQTDADFQKEARKYAYDDEKGMHKQKRSKNEQLESPINLGSPTQLAILFYDVLKCPQVSKKSPRGTGEKELKAIADKLNLPVCNYLLERREVVKLLSTYIDVIPELAKRWPDGRIRTHFNQYGAATGRLSSSDPINF